MPTLIVEDGSGVENANTYIDVAYLTSFASDRGYTISTVQLVQEQQILKAMDYLFWFADQWQGVKTNASNALHWPRRYVSLDCAEFPSNSIPTQLKNAQAQLVVEQQARTLLWPKPRTSTIEGLVQEKTVGPLTKKFAFTGRGIANANAPIKIMSVSIFLDALLSNSKTMYTKTVRV